MSEETSGSFTSRLFRKASANLAPAVTVQVADSPLSTRNSSSSPLAVERAPSFGNVVQSAVSTSNAITQDYILFSQPVIAAGTMVRRRKDGARMLVHFLAELPIGDEFVTVNDNSLVRSSEETVVLGGKIEMETAGSLEQARCAGTSVAVTLPASLWEGKAAARIAKTTEFVADAKAAAAAGEYARALRLFEAGYLLSERASCLLRLADMRALVGQPAISIALCQQVARDKYLHPQERAAADEKIARLSADASPEAIGAWLGALYFEGAPATAAEAEEPTAAEVDAASPSPSSSGASASGKAPMSQSDELALRLERLENVVMGTQETTHLVRTQAQSLEKSLMATQRALTTQALPRKSAESRFADLQQQLYEQMVAVEEQKITLLRMQEALLARMPELAGDDGEGLGTDAFTAAAQKEALDRVAAHRRARESKTLLSSPSSPKPTSGGDGKPPVAALDGAAERKLKLRMTVNIGEGRQGEIKVCEGDDPADLAALFCKIHALKSARVLKKIESHITDNLANLPTTPTAAPAAAPAEAK